MTDIKLYRPQRISDNPDGGGLATSVEIVDGEINNLFDDISRIDRANGAVNMRKFFAVADTNDASTFLGLHLVVKSPPLDEDVSAFLFRTPNWADERSVAQNVVERYLDPSVVTRMLPYDTQLAGQRTVLVFQRVGLPLPEIGEVYVLANQAGTITEFIRVTDMSYRDETFEDEQGIFSASVITLTLSQPLENEWRGTQPNRFFRVSKVTAGLIGSVDGSLLRASIVSNAARYYGTVPLSVDTDSGALTARVGTVFGQLVPAAVSETPVVNAPGGGVVSLLAAAAAPVEVYVGGAYSTTDTITTIQLPRGIEPGSLRFSFLGGASMIEDGRGLIGSATAIDYETGAIQTRNLPSAQGFLTVSFVPAAATAQASISENYPITLGTRGSVYVASLTPTPAPGSLSISYRALGRWYSLQDDGSGVLSAGPGLGVGSVSYITGGTTATLESLPDVGSSVIYSWGQTTAYQIRTQAIATQVPEVPIQLASGAEPGTVEIEWEAGGLTKTATDNGLGAMTGDATGSVQYSSGLVLLRPALLPDSTTTFEAAYEAADVVTEVFNPTKSGSDITLTAAGPLRERSVLVTYSQTRDQGPLSVSTTQQLADNGAGQLVDADGNVKAGSVVNYAAGTVTFNPDFTAVTPTLGYAEFNRGLPSRTTDPTTGRFASQASFGVWPTSCGNESNSIGFANGSAVTLQYKSAAATDTPRAESFPAPPIRVRLNRGTSNAIVPGSALFTLGGQRYVDRSGRLVREPSLTNGAGLDAGSISYSTGVAEVTSYAGGVAPALNVQALLTEVRPLPLSVATGRTPGSPIRPGSFILVANRYRDGVQITAVADQNGNIDSTDMHGYVDSITGVWSVAFGRYVLDSSLTIDEKAEPWYSIDAVGDDGYIWRPEEAQPGSVRFSCVVQTSLPLDPQIIKVNPVRLPQDGRVQFIKSGDTLVVHNTLPFTLPNPVEAGETYAMPRTGLASVVLYDNDGLGIPAELFTVDRAAGEITMADPLDLTGYTQPLTALHCVEDMTLCTDAQIDGTVSFAQPLTRGYAAGSTLVSSALVVGDVAARVANTFAQNTWTGVWSSELIGNAPTSGAAYNAVAHPIEVINANAITQRWRIQFTTSTGFNVVAEKLGIVATGTIGTDCAPANPSTGQPYFVIRAAGWGTGWATGNLVRFDTLAAGAPVWAGRCTAPGASGQDDRIRIEARYDRS